MEFKKETFIKAAPETVFAFHFAEIDAINMAIFSSRNALTEVNTGISKPLPPGERNKYNATPDETGGCFNYKPSATFLCIWIEHA